MTGETPERPRGTRALVAFLAFVLALGTIPHRLCEREAAGYEVGDAARVEPLARSVARWTGEDLAPASFATGASRFDGEWLMGTYAMGAMAFGQIALAHPALRAESLARMERCLDVLFDPRIRAFDRDAWGEEPLPGDRGHMGYLGYVGLPLALHRALAPASRFAAREEAFAAALERRFLSEVGAPLGLVETYPSEVYPVDNASGLAALALHARATHAPPSRGLARGLAAMRARGVDRATGLLLQSISGGERAPRGSGTALAIYFLAFADEALAASLYKALHAELYRTVLGFGVVLEHPGGASRGDVDSGPVVLGFGVSATGFAIGASRALGDADAFRSLYATAHLFGAPSEAAGLRTFAAGGPLGDAILLAMLTAPRSGARGPA
jgi:hypothetical protein